MTNDIILEKGFEFFPHNGYFGFIIRAINGSNKHCGFFFKNSLDNSKIYFLHLMDGVKSEIPSVEDLNKYAYTWFTKIPPSRARAISTKLSLISDRTLNDSNYQSPPFGFIYSGLARFNENQDFIPKKFGDSLTCATFILCILEDLAIFLIDKSTWHPLEEDNEWKYELFDSYISLAYSQDYINAQRAAISKCARYKPEEVVGSSFLYQFNKPAIYTDVQPAAKKVISEIERLAS